MITHKMCQVCKETSVGSRSQKYCTPCWEIRINENIAQIVAEVKKQKES
jgi:hypothetical protein